MKRLPEFHTLTFSQAINSTTTILSKYYIDPYIYALSIVSNAFQIDKNTILTNLDNPITEEQYETMQKLNYKLSQGYPLSYILGNTEFFKEKYEINESVLIPRPETELLVEQSIAFINTFPKNRKINILEIGTGSGCISISILNNIQNSDVCIFATDISEDALNIARKNVKLNLQKSRSSMIKFLQQDVLSEFPRERFDLILSNPPYIPFDEYKNLDESLFYEPDLALTDFSNGLKFYKRLALLVRNNLNTGGIALFELHSSNVDNIVKEFKAVLDESTEIAIQDDTFGRKRFIMISI